MAQPPSTKATDSNPQTTNPNYQLVGSPESKRLSQNHRLQSHFEEPSPFGRTPSLAPRLCPMQPPFLPAASERIPGPRARSGAPRSLRAVRGAAPPPRLLRASQRGEGRGSRLTCHRVDLFICLRNQGLAIVATCVCVCDFSPRTGYCYHSDGPNKIQKTTPPKRNQGLAILTRWSKHGQKL